MITNDIEYLDVSTFAGIAAIHNYLLAMEGSSIKDVEIKVLLKGVLSDEINSPKVYMKGIDQSHCYEGLTAFKTEEFAVLDLIKRIRPISKPNLQDKQKSSSEV